MRFTFPLSLLLATAALAQTAPQPSQAAPAATLLAQAQEAARPGGRTVLVAFHASWCSWCRRLEATFQRPAVKTVMDRHFVIQWLTVQERGAKTVLDNPGAADLYQRWTGGAKAGIPFYLVLDAQGAPKGTSIRSLAPGQEASNIGYPGSPEEIQGFIALLKQGAPSLTQEECATLTRELEAASPKH